MRIKKAISPVVATALLIVVAVVSLVGFQTWYSNYQSGIFSNTETKSQNADLTTQIELVKDGVVYFNNQFTDNITIQEIKVGNISCNNISGNYSNGINEINLATCIGDITEKTTKDIVVITNKGIYEEKVFLDLFTNYCVLDGVSLRTGENGTFYSSQIAMNCSSLSQVRFCDNGELNGSSLYMYSSCEILTFRSVWNTSKPGSAANQIVLPLESSGTYNFVVDWGDGSNNTITIWNQSNHTYATPGVYQLNITGTIVGFRFNNGGDRQKIIEIKSWGPLRLGNSGGYFWNCNNLQITATDILNMSGTTILSDSFRTMTSLTSVPSMNSWDMSKVTTMQYMFYGTTNFNQDLNSWNTSNVTSMFGMFQGATNFNGNISSWDTGKVNMMPYMFYQLTNFNQDISSWDVSNVTNMFAMFSGATSFNQNLSSWNVGSMTNMMSMFSGATSFNQNLSSWNVSNVTLCSNFNTSTPAWTLPKPSWSACTP